MLLHSSYLPLGVTNGRVTLHASSTFSGAVAGEIGGASGSLAFPSTTLQNTFSGAVAGEAELLLQGESLTPNLFTLLFVLLSLFLFYFVCFLYIKNTQKKK